MTKTDMPSKPVFSKFQRNLFITGILFLFIPKLINSYFLMPFPGSMDIETMSFSFWLDKVANFFLFTGGPIVAWGCWILAIHGTRAKKAGAVLLFAASAAFYYYSLVEFQASEMFKEPTHVVFKQAVLGDYNPDAYILGVTDGKESKAYPVKYLAYHHKIHDRINAKDILVTYCSMCRSGRVFLPFVEGEKVTFRLVGARHYNAIIEDSKTKTWWYQATGVAGAGPLKGWHLEEFPAEQTTWKSWIGNHPNTMLLQPDPDFTEIYEDWFANFDSLRSPSDSIAGTKKIWVVGIATDKNAVAYPIPALVREKTINDRIGNSPLVITIESDSLTTHVYFSTVENKILHFEMDPTWTYYTDKETSSKWNFNGLCTEGFYIGRQLNPKQNYNEYLRSWERFHPGGRVWRK